jgi:hypothetical protein
MLIFREIHGGSVIINWRSIMKNSLVVLACSALCMAANVAHADCDYPKGPSSIPNASSASEAEMIEAMSAFKQYNMAVDDYVLCLDNETKEKAKDAAEAPKIVQIKAIQAKKKLAATDELKIKVDEFNKAVREFKAKSKG